MTESEKPQVCLDFERVLCARHGEPFRACWPRGYPKAVLMLFQRFIESDEAHRATASKIENVNVLLSEKPLCCRVGAKVMLEAYTESGIGRVGRCRICGTKRLGTPYTFSDLGRHRTHKHVCFRCVLNHMRPDARLS